MKKIVLALSGGMDSATLLGYLLEQGAEVHCCVFYYGSKHGQHERKAAENLIDYYQFQDYPVQVSYFDLTGVFTGFNSALLNPDQDIPEGHYAGENMRKTVVPGRNLIFASILAGIAESIGAKQIALGTHAGDHFIYPDCRTEFIKSLDTTIFLSSDRRVEVITPLDGLDKGGILKLGLSLKNQVPYHLTRTCYKGQPKPCGKCGSCVERLEAFQNNNLKDPVEYE